MRIARSRRCRLICRPDKRFTRHPAMGLVCGTGGRVPFRRPDKRFTRHPAMGLVCGIGGKVPFTRRQGVSSIPYAVNGTRGAAALPLSIPAAPRGNRCCALRSPPACLTAAGSTRLTRSISGTSPCLGSPLSAIHGVQTLSFPLRFADFSGDTTPRCHIADQSHTGVAVGAVFVGRIRRSRHPAIDVAETLPDGAYRLSGLRRFSDFFYVGRIRRSRHPAIGAAERMPGGASLIRPTRFQRLFVLHYSVYALFSPISAV